MADTPDLELFHAAPETAKTVAAWLAYFKTERRSSEHLGCFEGMRAVLRRIQPREDRGMRGERLVRSGDVPARRTRPFSWELPPLIPELYYAEYARRFRAHPFSYERP